MEPHLHQILRSKYLIQIQNQNYLIMNLYRFYLRIFWSLIQGYVYYLFLLLLKFHDDVQYKVVDLILLRLVLFMNIYNIFYHYLLAILIYIFYDMHDYILISIFSMKYSLADYISYKEKSNHFINLINEVVAILGFVLF